MVMQVACNLGIALFLYEKEQRQVFKDRDDTSSKLFLQSVFRHCFSRIWL